MDQGYAAAVDVTRPLRRDAERNRLLILSAARTLFAQRGLEVSLDEVAREAGLGVGTVYRRFPNRDVLIDALFADVLDEVVRGVEQAKTMPRAWDGLCRFMLTTLEIQARDKGLRDALFSRRDPDPGHDEMRQRIQPVIDDLVRRAKEQGDLRADVTATDIGVLVVAALGAAEFTYPASPDVWRRYLAMLMDGMRARPEGDSEPLTEPPLSEEAFDACMLGWKYGSREIPRRRQKGD